MFNYTLLTACMIWKLNEGSGISMGFEGRKDSFHHSVLYIDTKCFKQSCSEPLLMVVFSNLYCHTLESIASEMVML